MKASRAKVLFFVAEDWFVWSHWMPLIEGARDSGFEVVLVTRTGKRADDIRQRGIRVIPLEISRRGSNLFREIGVIRRLAGIYRDEKPDIVHQVGMKPMIYGSFIARITGVAHAVNWVAGMGWLFVSRERRARMMQFPARVLLGWLLRGTLVIVENPDDHAEISQLGVPERDIHLVPGAGVDTSSFAPSPLPEGVPIVVVPARMLWNKGIREFVEAARQLRQRGLKARFVLVGEPDPENPSSVPKDQLLEWEREGAVEWWGRSEKMPDVYSQSCIVCLPSYREGLSKTLLEAASCARPIVTTDVPGCRDVVRDRENGLLVKARDAGGLAGALAALLGDAELCRQMGQRGRERVLAEFSQERIVAQVLSLYRGVLS